MSTNCDYPDNWQEIATEIKQAAGYRCTHCGLPCLLPGGDYSHLSLSVRRKLSAQVHHRDCNPSHNNPINLVCLCAGCHLREHRYPLPLPGQQSLELELPQDGFGVASRNENRVARLDGLTLTDLLDRLFQLPSSPHHQLELDFTGDRAATPSGNRSPLL
jgi:hypothetical protein